MRFLLTWLRTVMGTTQWRWLPGSLALVVVAGCLRVGAFQSSEHLAFNTMTRLRGPQSWHDDIVIIEIDDKTTKAVGALPLSRRYYAQVIEFLMHSQSGVVVLDVVFSDPSPEDDRLGQAMLHHGQVVLAQAWNQQGFPTLPVQELTDNAIHSGHVLNYPDQDGITRSIRPYIQGIPALGIAAIQAYSLTTDSVSFPKNNQLLWVNWPGSNDGLEKYSFLDVLQRDVDSDRFENKLVIIGSSVAGLDPIATPFNQDPPATGIDLQAAVISNLLYGNTLRILFPPHKIFPLLLLGPLLSVFLSGRSTVNRWIISQGLMVSWVGIGLILLKFNVWMPVVWPITLIVLAASFTEISIRLKANAVLQQEVERLWQTYHQDVLIQGLQAHYHPMPLAPNEWGEVDTPFSPSSAPLFSSNADIQLNAMEWAGLDEEHQQLGMANPSPWLEPTSVRRTQQLTTLVEVFGRSQALHGAIARSLSIGLVAADWDGQVWFCNPAATGFLGTLVGHSLSEALIPHWLNQSTWDQYLHTLHQGQAIRWEHYHGSQWFEMSLEPLFHPVSQSKPHPPKQTPHPTNSIHASSSIYHDHLKRTPDTTTDDLMGVLLLVEDITTYKQVEVEVRNALAQEKEFNELKSRFVSMVSHELRTPLTIIRSSIEMLERRQNKELPHQFSAMGHGQSSVPSNIVASHNVQQKYFNRIDNAVSTMTQLLEDVLLLGKVEAKKLTFRPQYVNSVQLCQTIVEEMQVQPLGYPRIAFKAQGEVVERYMDVDLLKMILSNLLSNAVKYSPDHTIVHVDLDCSSDPLILRIDDQGIGIPAETQQQLFKEFHRATNVGNVPGTGLGLSIVKQCVDLHQGEIIVNSSVDVGSTFIVKLPYLAPD